MHEIFLWNDKNPTINQTFSGIVLSSPSSIRDSDYPCGIFKLLLIIMHHSKIIIKNPLEWKFPMSLSDADL
jgi:hypothetical protein